MIKRTRPKYTDDQLKEIYALPHDGNNWHDHLIRIAQTSELAKWIALDDNVKSLADLSCGNAAIAMSVMSVKPIKVYLGDFAPGYHYTGPIEQTVNEIPNVDLFILSETLEHLDDPIKVLNDIRKKTKYLILSTPDNAGDDPNPEHYWSWSSDDIKQMLIDCGFTPFVLNKLQLVDYLYDYQIWGAR